MVIAGVADTHAALWYTFGDPQLSRAAKLAFDGTANHRHKIALSVISLAEIVHLIEKGRFPVSVYDYLQRALRNPDHVLREAPLTMEIVDAMRLAPRTEVPDMPDRIVAATGLYFGLPVISRDGRFVPPPSRPSGEYNAFAFFSLPQRSIALTAPTV
jgi:PIN domain nuclease of toxin-antitoxin system